MSAKEVRSGLFHKLEESVAEQVWNELFPAKEPRHATRSEMEQFFAKRKERLVEVLRQQEQV